MSTQNIQIRTDLINRATKLTGIKENYIPEEISEKVNNLPESQLEILEQHYSGLNF